MIVDHNPDLLSPPRCVYEKGTLYCVKYMRRCYGDSVSLCACACVCVRVCVCPCVSECVCARIKYMRRRYGG